MVIVSPSASWTDWLAWGASECHWIQWASAPARWSHRAWCGWPSGSKCGWWWEAGTAPAAEATKASGFDGSPCSPSDCLFAYSSLHSCESQRGSCCCCCPPLSTSLPEILPHLRNYRFRAQDCRRLGIHVESKTNWNWSTLEWNKMLCLDFQLLQNEEDEGN